LTSFRSIAYARRVSAPLLANPFLSVEVEQDGDEVLGLRVQAPVRGHGLRRTFVDRRQEPELFALLRGLIVPGEELEIEGHGAPLARLAEIGLLVREDEVASRTFLRCELAAELPPLVPPPWRARLDAEVADRRIADGARFAIQRDAQAPALLGELAQRLARLEPRYPRLWVADPETAIWAPYTVGPGVGPGHGELLDALERGELPTSDRELRALQNARLLATRDPAAHPARAEALEAAAEQFRTKGYALVEQVLPPLLLAALRRYYRDLIQEGWIELRDRQADRYWAHNEHVARLLHVQLTPLVQRLAGEDVKPSYVYLGAYRPGAALEAHRDRAQCELSLSLLVDFDPEPAERSSWPLHFARSQEEPSTAVYQPIGSAVAYKGCELYHHRPALGAGQRSTSLFLHYVPKAFAGPLK
jgi:alkylated DNA repair dioxygenase AlkB